MTDTNDLLAKRLTDDRLADDLRRIGENVRMFTPDERAARLNEAARRLDRPAPQILVTLDDGRQVALMHGAVHVRSGVADSWALPLNVSDKAHRPGTVYFGEW